VSSCQQIRGLTRLNRLTATWAFHRHSFASATRARSCSTCGPVSWHHRKTTPLSFMDRVLWLAQLMTRSLRPLRSWCQKAVLSQSRRVGRPSWPQILMPST